MKRLLFVLILTLLSGMLAAATPGTNTTAGIQQQTNHNAAKTHAAETEPMAHHMMILAIQLGIIIFAARLFGTIFHKFLKLPSVLGELFAGIIIGGHLLGGITLPGFPHGLFGMPPGSPFSVSVELYGVASIASIILLFLSGLETDVNMFMRFSVTGTMVGLGGVVFSFVLGDLSAVLLSHFCILLKRRITPVLTENN